VAGVGRGVAWLDGEPNGRSEVGDEDSDEDSDDDKDEGREGSDDSVGGFSGGTIVDDRSRALINCPRYLGCDSQCLRF
jgi:hypothetical protein